MERVKWYPWLVITLASFLLFYKYLLQVFPSVITDNLMVDFQLSGVGLGNLAACFFYSYLIAQLFSGYLIDRFNFKWIITLSMLISAGGAYLFATSYDVSLAMLGRMFMGAGAAFATVGYMKTAAVYFPASRFGFVSGLLTFGVMLGAVFGEAPLSLFIHEAGWRTAITIISYAGIVIACLFVLLIQSKPKTHYFKQIQHTRIRASDLATMLKNKINWSLAFYSGLAFAPLAVFGGLWGVPFVMRAYQLNQTTASFYVSMVYVGFGFGGPVFGYLESRFKNRFLLMNVGLWLSFFTLITLIYFPVHQGLLLALTLLFGLGTGAFMLGFSVGKDANPLHIAATVVAFVNSGDAICGAISEPFIGKLLDILNPGNPIPSHFNLSAYHIALSVLPVEILVAYYLLRLIKKQCGQILG